MAKFSDVVRPFWLPGIQDVAFDQKETIRDWLNKKKFQVYSDITDGNLFSLNLSPDPDLAFVFGSEIDDFSILAFESHHACQATPYSNKASAWIAVKAYYSAYYAAHALLRICGRSCTYLTQNEVNSITTVASLYLGSPPTAKPFASRDYLINYDATQGRLSFSLDTKGKGSHAYLWKSFLALINDWIEYVSLNFGTAYQGVIISLLELSATLTDGGKNSGEQLSTIRNDISYRREYNSWFPYKGKPKGYAQEILKLHAIYTDTSFVDFNTWGQDRIKQVVIASSFLSSALNEILLDLSKRTSLKKSMYSSNSLKLISQLSK